LATLPLPLPPQALDLLNSVDPRIKVVDAMVDIVDVRRTPAGKDAAETQDLLVRGRDGKERTITLTDFGEFEMRRGQQMYGLFVDDTAILLYNPRINKHLMLPGVDAEKKRGLLSRALDPLDIARIVRAFATDPDAGGGVSRALRELRSNIDKINAEKTTRRTPIQGITRTLVGAALFTVVAVIAVVVGYTWINEESKPTVSIGNPPHVPGTPLVNYLDLVQLTLEETRTVPAASGVAPVCELVGSIYNRMGRKVDKMNFNGRVRDTMVAFTIEGVDKSSEKRGVVIGRHPGACLQSYKDRYELSEPECVLDGVVWKGCRDVIRILF
jgi:hypothetical protein